jgi:hypothetical protein
MTVERYVRMKSREKRYAYGEGQARKLGRVKRWHERQRGTQECVHHKGKAV